MDDFIGNSKCVTHHNACDCREKQREKQLEQLEDKNKQLKEELKLALERLSNLL